MSGYGKPDDEADNAQAFVDNYVQLAIRQLPSGEGRECCVECNATIPVKRRAILPGVVRCVACQQHIEATTRKPKIITTTYML